MTNILVCRAGTDSLATQLQDTSEITEVKLVGGCFSTDIKALRSTLRGHFITSLTIESSEEKNGLTERDYRRIAGLYSLRSLTLQGFSCPTPAIRLFTNLTHLSLDSASDAQIGAINSLTKLTSLHLGSTLEEKQIRWLFGLKNLVKLHVPFHFARLPFAPLVLARNLPALRRVTQLPQMPPLTPERIEEFFNTLQFQPKFLLRQIFCLQDSSQRDLFHYCRETLEGSAGTPFAAVLQYVDNETVSEGQLLEWLDFSLTYANRFVFEKVLSLQVDVNKPLEGGDLALVVAVQGLSISNRFEYFVQRLFENGANPSLSDGVGHSALQVAAKYYRSHLVKKFLNSNFQFSQSDLSSALEQAISKGIEKCRQDPQKAAHSFSIAKAVCKKGADETTLTAQLDRIMQCEVPVPVEVVSQLLKAGAKSTVKNSAGNTPLNELMRFITSLDNAKSTDQELWEVKFGYFKAIVENGDTRIKSYGKLIEIAKYHGVRGIIPFLHSKMTGK